MRSPACFNQEEFDRLFNINIRGIFIGLKCAVPLIRKTVRNGSAGSIINVSSAATFRPALLESIYCASKGAVDLLTRGLAREFGELGYNIRVNSVNPAIVYTDMTDREFERLVREGQFENRQELEKSLKSEYPLGRFADPEDVARLMVFLASDDASYITGVTYRVDGGQAA